MKKFFLFVFAGFLGLQLLAQNPPASPAKETENATLKIKYGAPSKKGRTIFGGLVPFDAVWRTGANNATEITLKKDVTIGGKSVKAGTYNLFTIPTAKDWTIIFNSELGQWGAYDYEKIKGKNVLEVKVPSMATDAVTEMFTITATDAGFDLVWDKTKVSVAVK